MPDAPDWDSLEPSPRRHRRLRIVGIALLTVVIVLGLTVFLGNRYGANYLTPTGGKRSYAGGADIWLHNCAQCHGRDGEGNNSTGGPSFLDGGKLHGLTFDQRVERITKGKPLRGMPSWRLQLSAEQIRQVAAYTQILSGQEPDPSVSGAR